MKDESFLLKLKQRLLNSKTQMLDGRIDGASIYREVCRIISNLLSIRFDDDADYEDEDDNDKTLSASTATLKASAAIKSTTKSKIKKVKKILIF